LEILAGTLLNLYIHVVCELFDEFLSLSGDVLHSNGQLRQSSEYPAYNSVTAITLLFMLL